MSYQYFQTQDPGACSPSSRLIDSLSADEGPPTTLSLLLSAQRELCAVHVGHSRLVRHQGPATKGDASHDPPRGQRRERRRPPERNSVGALVSLSLPAQLTQRVFSVPPAQFQDNYLAFLMRLRESFPSIPIFLLNSWGWPSADAPPSPWFPEVYPAVVAEM